MLVVTTTIQGQKIKSQGTYPIENYFTDDYGGAEQNWGLAQSDEGLIYVANSTGILEFDGVNWKVIELPNGRLTRVLSKNKSGTIFAGGFNEIGYLSTDTLANSTYNSILPKLAKAEHEMGHILYAQQFKDKAVFMSNKGVYLYNVDTVLMYKDSAQNRFSFMHQLRDQLFVRIENIGLVHLEEGRFKQLPITDEYRTDRIIFMLPYQEKNFIIYSLEKGFQIYDGKSLKPWAVKTYQHFKEEMIYCAVPLHEKYFAIGTLLKGLFIIHENGKVVQYIHKDNGLNTNMVQDLFVDRNQNLWCAKGNGISYIELNTPFTDIKSNYGLENKVYAIQEHKGYLYAGGEPSVWAKKSIQEENPLAIEKFKELSQSGSQTWDFEIVNDKLYASHTLDLLEIEGLDYKKLDAGGTTVFTSFQSNKNKDYLLCGTFKGISILKNEKGNWHHKGYIKGFNKTARWMRQDSIGNIWASVYPEFIAKITLNDAMDSAVQVRKYYLDSAKTINLHFIDNKIIVSSSNKFFIYHEKLDIMLPYEAMNQHLKEDQLVNISGYGHQQIWFMHNSKVKYFKVKGNDEYELVDTIFNKIYAPTIQYPVYVQNDSSVYLGTADGMIHYNPQLTTHPPKHYYTKIRNTYCLQNDSMIYGGMGQTQNYTFSIHQNSLRFEFAAIYFENKGDIEYSFQLDGFDEDWSNWTTETHKDYTGLREGDYTFYVKSKNVYGRKGKIDQFSFTILPPWYRSIWAYLTYSVLGIFLIYLLIKLNAKRLEKENIRLEGIVQERTLEIRSKKVQLEQQNEEILSQQEALQATYDHLEELNQVVTKKNQQIMDSIEYAKFIQEAILPDTSIIQQSLPQHFIYYRPKEQVSGDFYWLHNMNDNEVLWATADCTGHGVPGAMMSMIGNSVLNKVVIDKNIHHPAQILDESRKEIIKTLNSRGGDARKDGMDITLCLLNKKDLNLTFAAAYQTLYIHRKGEILEYKGDQQPVSMYRGEEKPFTQIRIPLEKGDRIYTFTDGYVDQLGGKGDRRFTKRNFKKIILDHEGKAFSVLENNLDKTFEKWKGAYPQIDDITIFVVEI